jgi:hypothetical protein
VPFRHLANAITTYALNGSDMHIEITGSAPNPYKPPIPPFPPSPPDRPVTLEVRVPNSWFVQTALDLHHAINALPTDAWHVPQLGDNATGPASPPYPSISEVFDTLLTIKARKYTYACLSSAKLRSTDSVNPRAVLSRVLPRYRHLL